MKKRVNSVTIAAPSSGSGKTTVVCALIAALKRRGMSVSALKCGPDYIDPMFHRAVLGVPSGNLDLYLSDENTVKYLYSLESSDITVIEGVMGFYDGMSMSGTEASTYEIAKTVKSPVIMVLACRGTAYTAAAIIKGIASFRGDSNVRGVILNGASEMTYKMLAPVIKAETGIDAVGYFPKMDGIELKSRHLGLVMPEELPDFENKLKILADTAEKTLDLEKIIGISKTAEETEFEPPEIKRAEKPVKIAVARDEAFCFYYRENMELLKTAGARIEYFSPLHDKKIPENASGVIFGGGYPELYAQELSQNTEMLRDVRDRLGGGMPCLAECGGFMYLNKSMQSADKRIFTMAGVIDADAFMTDRLVRFGYAELTAQEPCGFLDTGGKIRAHEFHYWDSTDNGGAMIAEKPSGKRSWSCMHHYKNTLAGFAHLYYYSNPELVYNFIRKCGEYNV